MKDKFEKEFAIGMKRMKKKECPMCGKKMFNVKDNITGRKSKYLWRCSCMPKNQVISMG